ncbi:IS66 family insertion sequence element accessory protein TnpB [Rhizobium rhododendri]|uniref:IS66 family insertion sequence element accessory protein TnpB n=1 Tax=Rhizobium rhododendri TaxID=2506430 RepID=A0ABY8IR16_9HYPH|nr:IS66 family insertion sequence element accessory protein TnpB [Rhizobium rhododendri]WFS26187.1 IS66 family insertion sequence element accessory protein TnpB [Rhizobium rhododendri]
MATKWADKASEKASSRPVFELSSQDRRKNGGYFRDLLKHDPLGGHLFCFRGRRGDLIKLIWHDGQGACLFTKKLERGRFIWPNVQGGAVAITPAQLSYLLSGIDWRAPQKTWRPTRV